MLTGVKNRSRHGFRRKVALLLSVIAFAASFVIPAQAVPTYQDTQREQQQWQKHVRWPVWQAGPAESTTTTSVSAS